MVNSTFSFTPGPSTKKRSAPNSASSKSATIASSYSDDSYDS